MPRELLLINEAAPEQLARCGASRRAARWAALGGNLAAWGVCSACCLLPALLIALGVTGAFFGWLDSLAAYKWYFLLATIASLGIGFYLVYFRKPVCRSGAACSSCKPGWGVRAGLWVALIVALSGIAFEFAEPMLRT